MSNALKYIGLTIIFLIIGYLIRDHFLILSLEEIKNSQINFPNKLGGQFRSHILFSMSIGIIPLLYLIVNKLTKINFMKQGLISCGIIIVCGISLWQFRIFQLNNRFQKLSEFDIGNGIQVEMSFGSLDFELYLFIGFIIGTILSIFIFKNKRAIE